MSLEEILEQAVKVPEKRVDFINMLINSEIYVIGTRVERKDEAAQELPALNMLSIKGKEKNVVPFFTSQEALNRFASQLAQGNPPFAKVKCLDFFKLASANKSAAVLNLNSQYSKEFPAEEIQMILDNLMQGMAVPSDGVEGNVIIAAPKNYPEDVVKALSKFCGTRLDIVRAYVFDMIYPKQPPKLLFVVDSEFNRPSLLEKFQDKLAELMPGKEDEYEIMSAKEPFCQGFVRGQKPFYSKSGN